MTEGLGSCCICGTHDAVGSILMLDRRAPTPGRGWGCVQCGLPPDGAVAVLCDRCFSLYQSEQVTLTKCCDGWPSEGKRVPIDSLPAEPFGHDPSRHPEVAATNMLLL